MNEILADVSKELSTLKIDSEYSILYRNKLETLLCKYGDVEAYTRIMLL